MGTTMSKLKSMIQESKAAKKNLVATTLRITQEQQSFIEGFSDYLSISKQDVMKLLLEEGMKVAEDELKLNENESIESSSKYYVLNTNKKNDVNDQEDMVENHIAAAFYDPWKFNIEKIQKGDTVFLYSNGSGVIAYGKGTGETLKKDRYGDVDECYYQHLDDFVLLDKPVKASDIKAVLGRNIPLLKTMSSISDGKSILDFITGEIGAATLPHACPRCNQVAKNTTDLERFFGFRSMNGITMNQSICRSCRSSRK